MQIKLRKLKILKQEKIIKLDNPSDLLGKLRTRSPAGFAIALHVHFTTPRYLLQSYSKEWIDFYSAGGLVMQDPTVHWAFANNGAMRWSDLSDADSGGVLSSAAGFGMNFGVVIALDDGGSKTMASFARKDREMCELDIAGLSQDLRALHNRTIGSMSLAPDIHETLKQMSIFLTHG